MIPFWDIKIGDKVTYRPEHYKALGKFEHGIVKEVPSHTNKEVRVVYNCNNDWANYKDYTSQLTPIIDLIKGWI